MKFRATTRRNLERDKLVVGKEWGKVYGGYFSDEKAIASFLDALKTQHWKLGKLPSTPKILYLASGNGLLGEHVARHLEESGFGQPQLTIADASNEHLKQNENPQTRKVLADALDLQLNEKFDLIIMRSSLDYQPTPALQIQMLKRVAAHLKPGGIFINQAASFETQEERDLADAIYKTTPKIGDRHFQWKGDLPELHEAAGLTAPQQIGEAPVLALTHEDHVARYGITPKDVKRIQGLIREIPAENRKAIKTTKNGYEVDCRFPIYAASRKR